MAVHESTDPTADAQPIPDEPAGFERGHEIEDSDDVFEAIDGFLDDLEEAATDEEMREIVQDYLDKTSALSLWRYSFNNQGAILAQMAARDDVDFERTATHFAGFNQWLNDHGRHVKKGESGFKILAPVKGWKCKECRFGVGYHPNNDDLGCEYAGEDPRKMDIDFEESDDFVKGLLFFKTVTVFAYEQTAPLEDADEDEVFEPVDYAAEGDVSDLKPAVISTCEDEFDVSVSIRDADEYRGPNGSKGYTRLDGEAVVLDRENQADVCRTLVHELAHELIHGDDDDEDDSERGKREVEAECVAYAVSRYFGIDADSSAFYVSRWNGDDRDELRGRFNRIRRTAADIVEAVEDWLGS